MKKDVICYETCAISEHVLHFVQLSQNKQCLHFNEVMAVAGRSITF